MFKGPGAQRQQGRRQLQRGFATVAAGCFLMVAWRHANPLKTPLIRSAPQPVNMRPRTLGSSWARGSRPVPPPRYVPSNRRSHASNLDCVYEDLGLALTDTISGSRSPGLQQWGLSDEQAKRVCSAAPACVGFSVNPDNWALFYSERNANSNESHCGSDSVPSWAKRSNRYPLVADYQRCGTMPWLGPTLSAAGCAKVVLAQPASAGCSHSYFVWVRDGDGNCACAPAGSPCTSDHGNQVATVASLYRITARGSWRSPACEARGRGWTSYRKVRCPGVNAAAATPPGAQPLEVVLSESHVVCGDERLQHQPPQPLRYPTVEKCVAQLLSLPVTECSHTWFAYADFHDQHHGECTCVPPSATCALDGTPSVSAGGLETRRISLRQLIGVAQSLYHLQARPERPTIAPNFPAGDDGDTGQGCWFTCHGIDGFGHQLLSMVSMMAFHGMRDRRGHRYLYDACVPFRIDFQHTTAQPDEHRMLRDFIQAGRDRFCDQHSPWRRQFYPAMLDTDIITRSPWVKHSARAEVVEDSTHTAKLKFVWSHDDFFRDMMAGEGGPGYNLTTEDRPDPLRCESIPDSNGPVIIVDGWGNVFPPAAVHGFESLGFESGSRPSFGQTLLQADPTLFPAAGIPSSTIESLRGYFFNGQIGAGRSPVGCPMVAIHLRRGDGSHRGGNRESEVALKTELLRLIAVRVPSASFRIHSDGGDAFVASFIAGMKLDDPARVHYSPYDTPLDLLRDLVYADLAILAESDMSTVAGVFFVRGAIVVHTPAKRRHDSLTKPRRRQDQEPAKRLVGNSTVDVYTVKGILAQMRETPDAPFTARWAVCAPPRS